MKKIDKRTIRLLFPISLMAVLFERLDLISFGFSLYFVIVIAIVLLMAFALLQSEKRGPSDTRNIHLLLLLGFIAVCIISSFRALYPSISYRVIFQYIELSILTFIISAFLVRFWNQEDWPLVGKAAMVLSAIGAITVITDLFGWTRVFQWYGKELSQYYIRPGGILGETNFAAGKLGVLLPINVYLLSEYVKRRKYPSIFFVSLLIALVIFAIFLTGSRLGLLQLIFILFSYISIALYYKFFKTKEGRRPALVLFVLVPFLLIAVFLPISDLAGRIGFERTVLRYGNIWRYLSGAPIVGEGSLPHRLELMEYAVEELRDNPFTGVGAGNFKYYAGNRFGTRIRYAHNSFLSIFAETGILGGILYVLLFLYMIYNIAKSRKIMGDFGTPFMISFLAMILMLFFLSNEFDKLLWGFFLPISIYLEYMRRNADLEAKLQTGI